MFQKHYLENRQKVRGRENRGKIQNLKMATKQGQKQNNNTWNGGLALQFVSECL